MKKRKLFLFASTLSALALPIATVACGDSGDNILVTETFANYAKQYIYRDQFNSKYEQSAGEFDGSKYSGSISGSSAGVTLASSGFLFRHEGSGKAEFFEEESISADGINAVKKTYVTKPSTLKWTLEYAKSIKLYVDGQEVVYDNDKTEPLGAPTIDGKYYASSFIELTSNDPKSINNPKFFDDLSKASKFEIEVDETSNWVDSTGKKTNYKIVARDFYYGILRTYLHSDTNARLENGGSKHLDETAKTIIPNSAGTFDEKNTFSNKYLYGLYNIDFDKIIDESTFIKKDGDKNYLVFQKADQNATAQFVEFYKSILFGNYDYVPAPSQYIDEMNKNLAELRKFVPLQKEKGREATIASDLAKATGKTKDSAVYWYGLTNDTTLYAGRYYYKGYDATDLTKRWVLNTEYKDQAYVNTPGRLKELQHVYLNAPVDANVYKSQNYNAFISGTTSAISFTQLDANTQQKIIKNKDVFGLSKSQSSNKKSTIGYYYLSVIPNYGQNKEFNDKYFNDAFAKLLWGATYEELNKGTAKNTLTYTTTGRGAEFRNIITSAINWDHAAKESLQPLDGMAWLTGVAQDTPFVNTDTDTPRKLADKINELFVVDRNTNQRIDLGGNLGTELRPSENNVVGQASDQKYQSAAYQTLKERFKTLVDEFYNENLTYKEDSDKEKGNSKIRFVISYRFTNYNQKQEQSLLNQVKVLNSLYPERMNVSVVKLDPQNATKSLQSYFLYSPSPAKIISWTSDYELINGSNDYRSWKYAMPILAAIAYDEEYSRKIALAYPTLFKAAQKLKTYLELNKETLKISIPVEKWSKLTNKDLHSLPDYLGHKLVDEEKSTDTNVVLKDIPKEDTTKYLSAYELSAYYLLWLNTDTTHALTKDELIKFTSELTNISGLLPNPFYTSTTNGISDVLVNPNYIYPNTPNESDYSTYLVRLEEPKQDK